MHDCCECSCKCRVKIDMSMNKALDIAERITNCDCMRTAWNRDKYSDIKRFERNLIFEYALSHNSSSCGGFKLKE